VREIFEISKFTMVFRCFPTVAAALASGAATPAAGAAGQ
jgi:hypothetical protein